MQYVLLLRGVNVGGRNKGGMPERYRSRITLAERRVKAFVLVNELIEKELTKQQII